MQVGTEGDQPEVVTRNDQLTMKSASKAARRDKVAKNKKKKRSNKGRKNAKEGKWKKREENDKTQHRFQLKSGRCHLPVQEET